LKNLPVQSPENPFSQTPYAQAMYAADTIKNIGRKFILKQKKKEQQQPVNIYYQPINENLKRITKTIENAIKNKKSQEEIQKLAEE
jgi:hypothetical protein